MAGKSEEPVKIVSSSVRVEESAKQECEARIRIQLYLFSNEYLRKKELISIVCYVSSLSIPLKKAHANTTRFKSDSMLC
ncbi:hypothetical protein ACFL96_06560 [Thermoproteota archaeon]